MDERLIEQVALIILTDERSHTRPARMVITFLARMPEMGVSLPIRPSAGGSVDGVKEIEPEWETIAASVREAAARERERVRRRRHSQPLPVRIAAAGAASLTLGVGGADIYQSLNNHLNTDPASGAFYAAQHAAGLAALAESPDDSGFGFIPFLRGEPDASAFGSVSSTNYRVPVPAIVGLGTSAAPSTSYGGGALSPSATIRSLNGTLSAVLWHPQADGAAIRL